MRHHKLRSGIHPFLTFCVALLAVSCVCVSCAGGGSTSKSDSLKSVYKPKYASNFEILGEENRQSTLIRVTSPWQGENTPTRELFIRRDGEPLPEGFSGEVLEGDAERIVCMSSTQIAMLHLAGAADNIVGVSGIRFITDQNIQSRRAEIGDVGYDGNINYELLVSLKPDLVLLYGISGEDPMERKLRELGIPFMYVSEYVEESPLGKAEWMIAVAETVGHRTRAEEVFGQIPDNYESLCRRVAEANVKRPKVMLNMPYGDSWFLPPTDSYFVTLINDAGGEYIYKKNNSRSSTAVDMEEAYMLADAADVWMNLGSGINSAADIRRELPKFGDLGVVNRPDLYNNTLRSTAGGGNDFFESGVVNPDLVLRDLIKALHPELVAEPFTYYRKLPLRPEPETEDEEEDMPDPAGDTLR